MVERLLPSDIIHQQGSGSPSIVAAGDRFERLLACRVPDLELDFLVVNFDRPRAELDTDRQVVLLTEPLVRELEKQARLADTFIQSAKELLTSVANDNVLEEVCVSHVS